MFLAVVEALKTETFPNPKVGAVLIDKNNKLTKVLIYPEKSKSMNLAFDITPAKYVTGLITEKGVCNASKEGLESLFK